jgi:hypothetical protein
VISTPPRFDVPPQVAVEFDARDVVVLVNASESAGTE